MPAGKNSKHNRPVAPNMKEAEAIRTDLAGARQLLEARWQKGCDRFFVATFAAVLTRLSCLADNIIPQRMSIEVSAEPSELLVYGRPIPLTRQEFLVTVSRPIAIGLRHARH